MQNTWLENRIHKWHYDHLEGSGGGDMGDFSTATLTILFDSAETLQTGFDAPIVNDANNWIVPSVLYALSGEPVSPLRLKICLYKGAALIRASTIVESSGNISPVDAMGGFYKVTGDATVTISQ